MWEPGTRLGKAVAVGTQREWLKSGDPATPVASLKVFCPVADSGQALGLSGQP